MEKSPLNNHQYQARRILILGTTGTGKTTLATRIVASHRAPLVLVYDWQGGEFSERVGAFLARDRHQLATLIDEGQRVCCYAGLRDDATPEEVAEDFEWFCQMAFELAGKTPGRKLIVVDECQDLIDPWNIPDGLGNLLSKGRRRMVDTLLLGRSANALHTVGRDQVNELYFFRSLDENSLKYPASLGLDADEIRDLGKGEFVYRNNETGETETVAMS